MSQFYEKLAKRMSKNSPAHNKMKRSTSKMTCTTFLPEMNFRKAFWSYIHGDRHTKGSEYFQNSLPCRLQSRVDNSSNECSFTCQNVRRLSAGAVPYGAMSHTYPFTGYAPLIQPCSWPSSYTVPQTPNSIFNRSAPMHHQLGYCSYRNEFWPQPPLDVKNTLSLQCLEPPVTRRTKSLMNVPGPKPNRIHHQCPLPRSTYTSPHQQQPRTPSNPKITSPQPGITIIDSGPDSPPVIIIEPRATSTPTSLTKERTPNLSWDVTGFESSRESPPTRNPRMNVTDDCASNSSADRSTRSNRVTGRRQTERGANMSDLICFCPEGHLIHARENCEGNLGLRPDYLTSATPRHRHPMNLRGDQVLYEEYFEIGRGVVSEQRRMYHSQPQTGLSRQTRRRTSVVEPQIPVPPPQPPSTTSRPYRGQGQKYLRF